MSALSVADDQLRSFFERWNRLEEEKTAISEDLKALFAEAKGVGFDTKAMRVVFRERAADDSAKLEAAELDQICDLYRASLGRARPASAPARTRENIEEFRPVKGQADTVLMQEPRVDGEGQAGAGEHGRVEGSQTRLPSDRAENKPNASAVIAGVPNPPSTEPTSSQASAKADDAHPLAASSADNFEPPAFLRERAYVLRPHCLRPDNCGSYGAKHCGSCERAARESEAA